ncbi:MAG: right-handed parallel beta-helix repeat-containing protein [Candidatus Omnitrophica bacterium]|nr:right-handed parallel beta-helix repeat-containing protein [Candidatus Omnitrophota bacterium]
MKTTKALTLVELILTMALSMVLLLGASQLIIAHSRFTTILQTGISLSQEAVVILEHISANVRNSKYVEIVGTNQLDIYDANNAVIGTYTWARPNLNYTPQGQTTNLVSNKLYELNISDALNPSNILSKVVYALVITKDAKFPNVGSKTSISAVYCRIPGAPTPVRLVVEDISGNVTQIKGLYEKIQLAINDAVDGDTVQVSNNDRSPYLENLLIDNKAITLKGAYDYSDWTRHLGESGYETIIDGNLSGRVINISLNSANKKVNIDGFTIKNGKAASGGGINASNSSSGSITISNNTIDHNKSIYTGSAYGGGINASNSSSGSITISSNIIAYNTATASGISAVGDAYGGGIYASNSSSGSITISNNTIDQNAVIFNAYSGTTYAGGIYAHSISSGSITMSNNNITLNTSQDYCGGIYADSSISGSITISNNIINNNTARHGAGAYAINASLGTITILNNTIDNNTGSTDGGGIYARNSTTNPISILNNTISNNKTTETTAMWAGAGIYAECYYNFRSIITISNNTIDNNTAAGNTRGGGICAFNHGDNANLHASLLTISKNKITHNTTTRSGGGISIYCYWGTDTIISNNIIAGNRANYGGGIICCINHYTSSTWLTIIHNTITDNIATTSNGGIEAATGSYDSWYIDVTENILYGNSPSNYDTAAAKYILYCCISPAYFSIPSYVGNINFNPNFVDDVNYVPTNPLCISSGVPVPPAYHMGAYGGPGAAFPIGFVMPTADNSATLSIREDVIGIY